jgi:hypothetical protein
VVSSGFPGSFAGWVVEEISLVLCLLSKQEKNFLCSSDQKKNWVFIFQNVGSWEAESIKAYVKVIFKKSGWLLARPWIEFPGGIFLGEGTTPHQSVTKRQLSKCCAVESRACKKEILSESAHTALSHGQVQEGQLRPKLAPGANEGGVCQDKVGCVRQHGLHNPKQACNLKDTNTTLCGRGDVYLLCKQADSQSPSMLLVTQASQQVADGVFWVPSLQTTTTNQELTASHPSQGVVVYREAAQLEGEESTPRMQPLGSLPAVLFIIR